MSRRAGRWAWWAVLVVLVAGPLYLVISASFKRPDEIIEVPPTPWPTRFTLDNYRELFTQTEFPTYLANSLIVAGATTVLTVAVATLAGYGMYRLHVRGAAWLARAMLLCYLAPSTLLLVPIYTLLASIGLVNRLAGLVVVNVAFAAPFCVWLLRGFFDAIPRSIDEAAAVDGAGPITILVRVNLPLLGPGIGTIALYSFVYSWTEFTLASQLMVSDSLKPVTVGLAAIIGSYNLNWGLLMSGASVAIIPTVLLFALVGRYFVRGLVTGATTG